MRTPTELSARVKIRFGHLLTMTGEEYDGGELIVEAGRIAEVSRVPVEPFDDSRIDLSDCLLLPGFVNAHCHLALSALGGKVPRSEKFSDWAPSLVAQNQSVSRDERVRHLRAGAESLLRSGVTALGDYLAMPELLDEYEALPFRQVVFLEVLGFNSAAAPELAAGAESVLRSRKGNGGLLKLGVAPHAPYSVSPELFRSLRRLADRYDCPFSCHVAEFPEEVDFLKNGGGDLEKLLRRLGAFDDMWRPPGLSPIRYLDSLGVLERMLGAHLNHVEEDLDILQSRNASAAFCPGSSRWFGRTRLVPVRRLLDRGVAVALGTDSLASNESLDFFRELRLAEEALPDVSRREILEMATRGGASALGLRAGMIAPGMPADLIALRATGAAPVSWTDIPFAPDRSEADLVMLDGKTVFHVPSP